MNRPAYAFDTRLIDYDADEPRLALRRHTDRCFFRVEEVVPGPGQTLAGFIVEGVLIDPDDVAELRPTAGDGAPLPTCGADSA